MLDGITRKAVFPLVFLSATSWIVFCVGFGMRNEWMYGASPNGTATSVVGVDYFTHWCFAISAVPLYFMAFVDLLCGGVCTGMVTFLLVPVYLVSAGGVLQRDGDYIYEYHRGNREAVNHVPVEFAGVLASVVFYWVALVLWPLYGAKKQNSGYTPLV